MTLSTIYSERNELALAFAAAMNTAGYVVGKLQDPDEPDWPVLVVHTPFGQVSWHLPDVEMPDFIKPYPEPWDGHTTPEKRHRLQQLIHGPLPRQGRRPAG